MIKLPRPSAALVVASLALVISCTGVAVATGGPLVLGAKNQTNKTTQLKTTAAVTGPTLKLANPGGGPAAQFVTNAGKAPFRVNRTTKVTNLNADLIDGVDSSSFLRNDSTPLTAIIAMDGSTPQTSQTATGLILSSNIGLYDPSGMRKAQGDRLWANVPGSYVISATVDWAANATGYRSSTLIDKDGVAFAAVTGPATGGVAVTRQNLVGILHMEADDYVRVQVLQGSGGDLNVRLLRLQMTYVGA